MQAHLTRFMERCVSLAKEVVVGPPAPAVRKGAGGFADWPILAVHCLRERETETYRSVVDKRKIMGPIRDVLDLERDELPHPSTLCKAMDRLTMALCRRLLQRTTTLQELGDVEGEPELAEAVVDAVSALARACELVDEEGTRDRRAGDADGSRSSGTGRHVRGGTSTIPGEAGFAWRAVAE